MIGWSSGTLQSSTRSGLASARRWQSSHICAFTGSSASRSAATYRGRSVDEPTEFSASRQPFTPSSSSSDASISSTSASRTGLSDPEVCGPITSAPICQNCR